MWLRPQVLLQNPLTEPTDDDQTPNPTPEPTPEPTDDDQTPNPSPEPTPGPTGDDANPNPGTGNGQDDGNDNTAAIVVPIILIILIALAIVGAIYYRKKNEDLPTTKDEGTAGPQDGMEKKSFSPMKVFKQSFTKTSAEPESNDLKEPIKVEVESEVQGGTAAATDKAEKYARKLNTKETFSHMV